ncbi:MAG: hypothetical protein AAGF12_43655 [Myxococcota bacterium]
MAEIVVRVGFAQKTKRVAGQDSGALEGYRIEPDGTLTSLDVLRLGDDLRWVVIR